MKLTFVIDVDGVMTTGQFLYSERGKEFKTFGPHDADGLKLLGGKVDIAFISADRRGFAITQKRIADMGYGVELVSEQDRYAYIRDRFGLARTIYMGDGMHDAPVLRDCLLGIAPADARREAKSAADFVTPSDAGKGAVCDGCLEVLRRLFPVHDAPRGSDLMGVAKQAALAAAPILRGYRRSPESVSLKSDGTLVTEADRAAELVIRGIIRDSYPEHAIVGEEHQPVAGTSTTWYIDPLDGTRAFANGIPASCISIGFAGSGGFRGGVIYDFNADEMFAAEDGAGAWLNDAPIRVTQEPAARGVLSIGASFRGGLGRIKPALLERLSSAVCHSFRMTGSNALQLADVARGFCVAHVADAVHVYDFAAGVVLVREAGGCVTDAAGAEVTPQSRVVVASHSQETHDRIIQITRDVYAEFMAAAE